MLELMAGLLVAILALTAVLEPLARRHFVTDRADREIPEFIPIEEIDSPKIRALLALKEIEFDRATGKLADEDYERLRAQYADDALSAIKAEATAVQLEPSSATDPAEALISEARRGLRVCATCGPRPEADATFWSNCGQTLEAV